MGLYDSVQLPCPECRTDYWAQSKGGACCMARYGRNECPDDVWSDIRRHAPFTCENCGCEFDVMTIIDEKRICIPTSYMGERGTTWKSISGERDSE